MKKQPVDTPTDATDAAVLAIDPAKVCWIIVKAREFDAKEAAGDPDPGSNAADDRMISVLEDRSDDPVEEELRSFIGNLSDDEQIDLVALMWLGREDNTLAEWPAIRAEAARVHTSRGRNTASYLLGEPLVSDFLDEGLALHGKSCEELEDDFL